MVGCPRVKNPHVSSFRSIKIDNRVKITLLSGTRSDSTHLVNLDFCVGSFSVVRLEEADQSLILLLS